jgi:hypothetical protein
MVFFDAVGMNRRFDARAKQLCGFWQATREQQVGRDARLRVRSNVQRQRQHVIGGRDPAHVVKAGTPAGVELGKSLPQVRQSLHRRKAVIATRFLILSVVSFEVSEFKRQQEVGFGHVGLVVGGYHVFQSETIV